MARRYLISLGNCDLQFVITLKLNINEFWGFCEFLGKIDNISSHISPIATLLVPKTTNNSDLMGSFWSLWAKVWGNRKWLQNMAAEKSLAMAIPPVLYSCKPTPQTWCHLDIPSTAKDGDYFGQMACSLDAGTCSHQLCILSSARKWFLHLWKTEVDTSLGLDYPQAIA